MVTRRELLQRGLAAGGIIGVAGGPAGAALRRGQATASGRASVRENSTLRLAQILSRVRYEDLPPRAIEYAKIIIASTLASAAFGCELGSSRALRDLIKEAGGRPEATIWFDGFKAPVASVARMNAMLSDASASDDSDIRNTVHAGTTLASAGMAFSERTGASGKDLLLAMVIGYEACGRINQVIRSNGGGVPGIHASQLVAFGGAVLGAKLLGLTDQQMAEAIGIAAITMGGIAVGTDSWAREYMGANASFTGANAALAASKGFAVNEDMLATRGGYFATYGGPKADTSALTRDTSEWDILEFLAIKLVPGAHANHATAEAAVNAARQANVAIDQIARIYIARPQRNFSVDATPPKDAIEAIHSLEYFVASAVIDKDYSWIHVSDAKIHRPEVARVMALIEADPAPPAHRYPFDYGGTATIVARSGARFTSTVDAPRASAPRGIEWSDIEAKYQALMPGSRLPASRINESFQVIRAYEKVRNASELLRLLKV